MVYQISSITRHINRKSTSGRTIRKLPLTNCNGLGILENPRKTFDPYAQIKTLAKEVRYNIWRHNGSYNGAETCEPSAETQHQHRTLQRRRTGHFKHHTERHRKHQKRNMPHLQSQWTTDYHRSQQTDHQFLRRHFQPKQKHLPALHKA